MSNYLQISVTFLDPRFHGRCDGGEPEWPPSPLRLMQAIVAANPDDIGVDGELDRALAWLESRQPSLIVAPRREVSTPYCLSVPNNAMDIVRKAWSRGNYLSGGDANPATHRAMKVIRAIRMIGGDTAHYLWKLDGSAHDTSLSIQPLIKAARRIVALGWGIDLVVGQADRVSAAQLRELSGERWIPDVSTNVAALRTPVPGTLDALRQRYDAFLHRIDDSTFSPVEPLTRFEVVGYRRPTDPIARPYAVFELRHDDGAFCRFSQRKLMHIAGMLRHLAIDAMRNDPPVDVDDAQAWVGSYVRGYRDNEDQSQVTPHRQFSYLPLPSIGHQFADQAVRRVMIIAPVADGSLLEHLARRLAGRQLRPDPKWGDPQG